MDAQKTKVLVKCATTAARPFKFAHALRQVIEFNAKLSDTTSPSKNTRSGGVVVVVVVVAVVVVVIVVTVVVVTAANVVSEVVNDAVHGEHAGPSKRRAEDTLTLAPFCRA